MSKYPDIVVTQRDGWCLLQGDAASRAVWVTGVESRPPRKGTHGFVIRATGLPDVSAYAQAAHLLMVIKK